MGKDENHKSSRSKHKHKKHSSKHKKDRKREKSSSKRRRDRSSSPSSSSSGSDAPRRPDVAEQLAMGRAAARAVREILAYNYDLRGELRQLARHLDSGAALDISGVADPFLRSRLFTAFDNLLQLRKTSAGHYLRVSGGSSVASFVAPFLEETPAALASYAVPAAPEPAPAAAEVGQPEEVEHVAPHVGPEPMPAGEEEQEKEEAAAPAGPASRPEEHSADVEAEEAEQEGSRRVLGPAMPPPEVLAAAAAMEVPPEPETASGDDLGDLVGPPPPEFAAETEAMSMDDRDAEVTRVLRVLEEHKVAAAAAPLPPAAAGAAPEPPPPDAYLILGVDPAAPAGDIKKRYWRLSLLIHPDKCNHPAAAQAFQAVSIAATALQDAAGRAAVDKRREAEELRRFTAEYTAAAERERAWRIARGEATTADLAGPAPTPGKAGGREAWMTELPEVRAGPVAGPPQGNQTAFSTRGPAPQVDASVWTMTPQERAAAAAGGGAAGPAAGPGMLTAGPAGGGGAPGKLTAAVAVNASTRGKSLLEKHLEKQEKAKRKDKGEEGKKRKRKKGEGGSGGGGGGDDDWDRSAHPWRPFDRERDLERKPAGATDPKELLKNMKGLSSRFAGSGGR